MANNDVVKIPEKVYVGFQGRRSEDEVPLGFMTPYTDDQQGLTRRNTVDKWAKGYGQNKQFNGVTMDNKPMIGFKIGRSVRRSGGWSGSGASYVRIEDPRGFELEITIENLIACMECAIIEQTEIFQECVWGRVGNRNILLPTNSQPFRDSITTTSAVAQALDIKSINIGDEVLMISGEHGVFMGSMNGVRKDWNGITLQKSKKGVLRSVKNGITRYQGFTDFKVQSVITPSSETLTTKDSEIEIFNELSNNPYCCDSSNSDVRMWLAALKGVVVGNTITHHIAITDVKVLMAKKDGKMPIAGARHYQTIGDMHAIIAKGVFILDLCNFYQDQHDRDFGYTVATNGTWATIHCQGKYILSTSAGYDSDKFHVDESEIHKVTLATASLILANGQICPIYE